MSRDKNKTELTSMTWHPSCGPIEVHFIVEQVCLCDSCVDVRHPSLDPIKNYLHPAFTLAIQMYYGNNAYARSVFCSMHTHRVIANLHFVCFHSDQLRNSSAKINYILLEIITYSVVFFRSLAIRS